MARQDEERRSQERIHDAAARRLARADSAREEQVYHRIGSLVPSTGESPKFSQIYFIDNQQTEVATRCGIVDGLRLDIVRGITELLHDDNHYVQLIKVAKKYLSSMMSQQILG